MSRDSWRTSPRYAERMIWLSFWTLYFGLWVGACIAIK